MEIEKYLLEKGIKPHYRGFKQLAYAIELCQKNPKYLQGVTTHLYPDISKDLSITIWQVEKNMRYAIINAGINKTVSEFLNFAILELKIRKENRK